MLVRLRECVRVDRIERPTGLHTHTTMWVPSKVRVGAHVTRDIYMVLCVVRKQSAAIVDSNLYHCQTGLSVIITPFLGRKDLRACLCVCALARAFTVILKSNSQWAASRQREWHRRFAILLAQCMHWMCVCVCKSCKARVARHPTWNLVNIVLNNLKRIEPEPCKIAHGDSIFKCLPYL